MRTKDLAEKWLNSAQGVDLNFGILHALIGVIFALLFIGEVLDKRLKDIATNTKRIGNG